MEAAEKQLPALRREAEAGWAAQRELHSLEQASAVGREEAEEAAASLRQQLQDAEAQLAAQVRPCAPACCKLLHAVSLNTQVSAVDTNW